MLIEPVKQVVKYNFFSEKNFPNFYELGCRDAFLKGTTVKISPKVKADCGFLRY